MDSSPLDPAQSEAAAQFERQSERYGKSHILANTGDIAAALDGIEPNPGDQALDVATGGGHTALFLAEHGWQVTAGDIAPRMLANTFALCEEAGHSIATARFPGESIPFPDGRFQLLTARAATHHFSSPDRFVAEAARVLQPGGHLLVIDGSSPDNDPETEQWLHQVEKWRDPSHGRFLTPTAWKELVGKHGFEIEKLAINPLLQPDLHWYFETASTSPENRRKVHNAVDNASPHVRKALGLNIDGDQISWFWPRLTLVCRLPRPS